MSNIFKDIYNKNIALEGDNNSCIYKFELPLMIGELDMSNLMYKLDIEKSDKSTDICELDKEISSDKIILSWTITNAITNIVGKMKIQIRGINNDNSIVWHSRISNVYINSSLNSTEKYVDIKPSEFEEIETRVSAMKEEINLLTNELKNVENNILSISKEISNDKLTINEDKKEVATNAVATSFYKDLVIEKSKFVSDEADRATNAMLNGVFTHNNSTTSHPNILSELEDVKLIAQGASQSVTFSDYESLVNNINQLGNATYSVGRNFNIITVGVPDLWISAINETYHQYQYTTDEAIKFQLDQNGIIQIGYYSFSELETQKVDLTEYYTKSEVNDLIPKRVTQAWYDEQYNNGTLPVGSYDILMAVTDDE